MAIKLIYLRWRQAVAFYALPESGGHAVRVVAVVAAAVAAVHVEGVVTVAPVHRAKPTVVTVRARLTTCSPLSGIGRFP